MSGSHQGSVAPAYTGLQLQTSSGAVCIPLCWGQARGAPNVIWYGDFSAKAQHAGKGAGPTTGYDYHASLMMALCQGPIHGVGKCWINSGQAVSLSATHFSLVSLGNTPQAPWSYLVSNFPSQADAYNGIAIVAAVKYDLGSSPYAPSTSYEVMGLRWNTGPLSNGDADCALIVEDFLSDDHHWGVGIPAGYLDNLLSTPAATTTGDNAYQTYCQAMGFGMSPYLQNQEQALTTLERWMKLTNTAVFWSGYSLKFVPYGDETVTAHGVTYLPDLTPAYTLTDADFKLQTNADPITISRMDPADCYNSERITISDRSHFYDQVPVDLQDLGLVQLYGLRQDNSAQATEICDSIMAATVVELLLNRAAYIRNAPIVFSLPECFCLLEPMDVLASVDRVMGAINCRVTSFEEQDDGSFNIEAEELTVGLSSAAGFTPQTQSGTGQNQLAAPDPVNPPVIFEPNSELAALLNNGSTAPIGIAAVSGGSGGVADPNWGGANVWLSTDGGTTYTQIGTIQGPARQGLSTAILAAYGGSNPDTGHTLSLNMAESDGQLTSVSAGDAANGVTVSYIDGEIIAYETATLTGTNAYDLTNLWRGLFGTTAGSHASGTQFARLDGSVFKFNRPTSYIGASLFLKFQSFNIFGLEPEDLSTCVAYPFSPSGAGSGGGAGGVPTTPTGFTATGGAGQVANAWSANPVSDNVTGYVLSRAPGLGASFGSASVVTTINALSYVDVGLPPATPYSYFLQAKNAVGLSAPTAFQNATTSTTGSGGAVRVIQVSENLAAGAFVNIWTSGGAIRVRNANGTDDTKPADGFVLAAVTSGANATVYGLGQQNTAVIGGPLTPGTEYYLDTTGTGGVVATAPSASGNYQQPLGKADTAAALTFTPGAGMGVG